MDKKNKNICALCSLPVRIFDFTVKLKNGQTLYFCCEGCVQIYRLFHHQELSDTSDSDHQF